MKGRKRGEGKGWKDKKGGNEGVQRREGKEEVY